MKRSRILLSLSLLWALAACNPEKKASSQSTPAAPGAETAPQQPVVDDLASPVTAPMKVRNRLRQDMRRQNAKAQERRRQLDAVIDKNR